MNSKGNLVVTIILMFLIGMIIYFVYWNSVNTDNISNINTNTTKKPSIFDISNSKNIDVNDSNVKINAKLNNIKTLLIERNIISFDGKITLFCSGMNFELDSPKVNVESGRIDLKSRTISVLTKKIINDDSVLNVDCTATINNFDKVRLDNYVGNFEEVNISGNIKIADIDKDLDLAYIKINAFTGNINTDNNYLYLDGNCKDTSITQNGTNIIIR